MWDAIFLFRQMWKWVKRRNLLPIFSRFLHNNDLNDFCLLPGDKLTRFTIPPTYWDKDWHKCVIHIIHVPY
jgi:hypothetical protein